MSKVRFSVFTKPWKTETIEQLGEFISGLGFDGIEFPLRSGYQVEPANAVTDLPKLVKRLEPFGLQVFSVASSLQESVFAGCAEAGIPIIRIGAKIDKEGFHSSIERLRQQIDNALPLVEKYGVKIGVQNHIGQSVSTSAGLLYLLEKYDPTQVGAIWDAAHTAMQGEEPEIGLSTVASHLAMVNFKNAYYERVNGPEAVEAEWKAHFTLGRHGRASWTRIANYLQDKGYDGVICLTAEYSDEHQVNAYIAEDIAFAKSLFKK